MSNLHFNGIHNAFKAKLRLVEESQRKVESDMSHRHKEAFFSHVGIQRLTKEAVCFINGSALRGPPNKRVSVSKCDLMIQKPLVFSQRGCVCLGDSLWRLAFVDERPAVTWLPWHRNNLNPLGGSFILIIMSRDKCVLEIRFWFLETSHKNILWICSVFILFERIWHSIFAWNSPETEYLNKLTHLHDHGPLMSNSKQCHYF